MKKRKGAIILKPSLDKQLPCLGVSAAQSVECWTCYEKIVGYIWDGKIPVDYIYMFCLMCRPCLLREIQNQEPKSITQ